MNQRCVIIQIVSIRTEPFTYTRCFRKSALFKIFDVYLNIYVQFFSHLSITSVKISNEKILFLALFLEYYLCKVVSIV